MYIAVDADAQSSHVEPKQAFSQLFVRRLGDGRGVRQRVCLHVLERRLALLDHLAKLGGVE
jgi:hypothetical protein